MIIIFLSHYFQNDGNFYLLHATCLTKLSFAKMLEYKNGFRRLLHFLGLPVSPDIFACSCAWGRCHRSLYRGGIVDLDYNLQLKCITHTHICLYDLLGLTRNGLPANRWCGNLFRLLYTFPIFLVCFARSSSVFGYLSNFATGFQKVPFFLKIDQNQWFQNSRFHFYLVFIWK